mmetsp:Transcript_21564/g.40631  ORF Transcript_21564/g.40631 Transcript_21564/m.40631 type:complete len:103 (-) Transcript_21564:273-581(-)
MALLLAFDVDDVEVTIVLRERMKSSNFVIAIVSHRIRTRGCFALCEMVITFVKCRMREDIIIIATLDRLWQRMDYATVSISRTSEQSEENFNALAHFVTLDN